MTPGVLVANVPFHVTFPETVPKFAGTGNDRAVRKISSLPLVGAVVTNVLAPESNVVERQVLFGENVICAFGTGRF